LPEVRAGRPADLADVAAIQAVSPEAAQWPVADYLKYNFRVATDGARVVGFLVARHLAPGESEVLNLAVHPDWRRKGVARKLVEAWVRDSPGTIFLEVRESNTTALRTYKSLYFHQVAVRNGYYDSPPEAAIVLKFRSC